MPARPLILLALSATVLVAACLAPAARAEPAPSPASADPRTALEMARARAAAEPASAAAQLGLAQALQRVGNFAEARQALARTEQLEPGYPAVSAALSALLVEWHAADPPHPGQASAYADACAAAKVQLGAPAGDRLAQLAHATCVRLANADAAAERAAPMAAAPDGKKAQTAPKELGPGLTPEKVLRIWLITAIGAAVFIGGATWLTRNQRGKGPPKAR